MTEKKAPLMKVGVLRHNGKAILRGKFPDSEVGRMLETELTHVLGAGIFLLQNCNEAVG